MKNSKTVILILFLVLFIALLITYSNHWNNGFHFDDGHSIEENVHIRNLKNIPEFFVNPKMFSSKPDHWGLRPVVTTTLAIDYWLGGGLKPFWFHLSTFIWFMVLCILIFFIYSHIIQKSIDHSWKYFIALIATAWYAMHPANAETINYIISRSDVLSTLCIVASFSIYIFYPGKRKFYFYIIPAIIGVFAKETIIVLVPLLFFYITLFEKQLSIADLLKGANFKSIFKIALGLLPLFIAIVICQVYTLAKTPPSPTGLSNPFFKYVATQSYVWVHYFGSFFLPLDLSADTDMSIIDPIDYRLIIGVIFIIGLVYTIFKTSKKKQHRPIAFGLLWFAFSLLPTSLAPLAEVMNDHRMFFPFIGLALAVVYTLALWLMNYENKFIAFPKFGILLGGIIIIGLSSYAYGTYQRNKVWKNDETLWYDVTVKSPKNGRGLMNYGLTQMSKGNYPVALSYFEKALEYNSKYYVLFTNLGIVKDAMGKPAEAEEYFRQAIAVMPGLFEPYYYYAEFLKRNNRIDEAKQQDQKALSMSPYYLDARFLLMDIYQEKESWDSLKYWANTTLEIDPNNQRAKQFLDASNKRVSKLDATIIQAANNNTPESYLNLSLQFFNKGLYEKCIEACQEAIKLKPGYADAYSNMGAAYNNLKQWDKAIEACNRALKSDPQHKLANGNLNWAKGKKLLSK